MFADRLEEFFAERPWFADLRESTETFLVMSQREFFADNVSTSDPDYSWLVEFARACRLREREST